VRDPDEPDSFLLLGRALARSGEGARAKPLFERFLALAPHHVDAPGAWHALAQIALEARDLAGAARAREAARKSAEWQAFHRTRRLQVRARPEEPLPRLGLAELWIAAGDLERAGRVLADLTALQPGFARGWARRADCERARGDRAAARSSVARALALEPELAEARHLRARLALDAGERAAARADLEWLVARPEHAERFAAAHLELARVLLADGDRAAAEARHARYRELGGREPLEP
jgi:tetratricopeptide (TPR) repeat protein